jgi:hypothetical protein
MAELTSYVVEAYNQWQDTTLCLLETMYWDGRLCEIEMEIYKNYSNTMVDLDLWDYDFRD